MLAPQLRNHILVPQYRKYCEADTSVTHPTFEELGIIYAEGPYKSVDEIMQMLTSAVLQYPDLGHIIITGAISLF